MLRPKTIFHILYIFLFVLSCSSSKDKPLVDPPKEKVSLCLLYTSDAADERSSDLLKQRSQSSVLVAGIKVAMQTPPVRSGKRVIFLTLDDGYGLSDSAFFTDVQSEYANVLYSTSLLLVRGVTRRTGAKGISIRATGAWDLRAAYESWSAKQSTLAI